MCIRDRDKADITIETKKNEKSRDDARTKATSEAEHSREMGLSITLFQVAIALGATALIVKKKPLWVVSTVFGALAVAQMMYVLWWLPM